MTLLKERLLGMVQKLLQHRDASCIQLVHKVLVLSLALVPLELFGNFDRVALIDHLVYIVLSLDE